MNPTLAITAIMVCARLVALAIRLRARTRYQNQQLSTLLTLASRLPPHTLLALDDPHGDGTRLRLRIDAEQQERHARA